jgi:tRNA(Ile)-lysidine synthase
VDDGRAFETPSADPAGFAASWEWLGAPRRLLLAVSGGSDSIALMRLAAPMAESGRAKIAVATVDHVLRAEARREAEAVGAAACALGLAHEILVWTGEKPTSGLQAAARAARYGLLIRHADTIGAEAIMTAHTADDQAETFLMRLARGAGPRGLSAMAPSSLIAAGASAPIPLLRPLLGFRRAALRSFLAAEGADFIDDPSNEDAAYERVRVRKLLGDLETSGALTVEALVETADQMRAAAATIEAMETARFEVLHGAFDPWGGASLGSGVDISDASLMARLIFAVSGGDYAPSETRAGEVSMSARSNRPATLGGVLVAAREGRLFLTREPAAVLGRQSVPRQAAMKVAPGARVLWDGRFIVANPFDTPASLRPLERTESRAYGDGAAGGPVLEIDGEIVAIPGESNAFTPLAAERFHLRVNRFH